MQNTVGVTKPLDMEISEQNESRVPASEQIGLRGDVAASAMYGHFPLQECSADERRAFSHSEKDASGMQQSLLCLSPFLYKQLFRWPLFLFNLND